MKSILMGGDAMKTIAPSDTSLLLLASLILRDVTRTVAGIQAVTAVLVRYALIGASIAEGLIWLVMPVSMPDN